MSDDYYTVRQFLALSCSPSRSRLNQLWKDGRGPARITVRKSGHKGKVAGSRWGRVLLPKAEADQWLSIRSHFCTRWRGDPRLWLEAR